MNYNHNHYDNSVPLKGTPVKNNDKKITVHQLFKQELNRDKSGKGYICPICGSGQGKNGTGITENPKNPYHYTCWAGCFTNSDAFDIIALQEGIQPHTKEAMQITFKRYDIDFKSTYVAKKQQNDKLELDYTHKLNEAAKIFLASPAEKYINNRGISTELAQRFNLGYSPKEYFPDKQYHSALIIPINKNFYICRNIDKNISANARFSNVKGSKSDIFNLTAINEPNHPIFIVESTIDALSIMEAGGQAIALNSTSNANKLIKYLDKQSILPPFILCLDKDTSGQKATDKLINAFTNIKARFIDGSFILENCKDANERLILDKKTFSSAIANIQQRALTLPIYEKNTIQKLKKEYLTIEILENELKLLNITVKYNLISNSIEVNGYNKNESPIHILNNLPTLLYSKLCSKYKGTSQQIISDYIMVIATRNRFNPVLDLFEKVVWDGKDHLQDLYNALHIDNNDVLSKTLILKWFWQGHALLRNSESEPYGADGILTLAGKQGIGKTSFFRHMSIFSKFFREGQSIDNFDKDNKRRCITTWITELGEVDTTLKSDMGMLKAFITNAYDEYRLPYGRVDQQSPRRTNLAATVNSTQFLIDPTGNRRFWTIPLECIDLNKLNAINATQVWIQVWEQYAKHDLHGFRLSKIEQKELAERNQQCEKGIKSEAEILDILDEYQSNQKIYIMEYITVSQFKLEYDTLKIYSVEQIGRALDKIGILAERKIINGKRQRARLLPVPKNKFS